MQIIKLFIICLSLVGNYGEQFTNKWMVKVNGDENEAKAVAVEYNLQYIEQVFENYYTLIHEGLPTRSAQETADLTDAIGRHQNVLWVQQQTENERELMSSTVDIQDPNWNDQKWYLLDGMKAESGWARCYTGAGVNIAVVDDGVENNRDLNVDSSLSRDFRGGTSKTDSHGTQVAGIAAAKMNDFCGVGVAPDAKIANLRIFGLKTTTTQFDLEAKALSFRTDKISIYVNSWGVINSGVHIGGPNTAVLDVLKSGTRNGRGGKGAIYLWATGNGGPDDSCAYDGYINNIYSLGISGVDRNYRKLINGESCSAVFAAAPSQNVGSSDVISTIGDSRCTRFFGQSSAAVPMAAGAIAIILQENPSLTWRDVKHIIARSANSNVQPNEFQRNAAGYLVSPSMGFGVLDVEKMVQMAHVDNWKTVGGTSNLVTCEVNSHAHGIPSDFLVYVSSHQCKIQFIEEIEVAFDLTYSARGHVKMTLTSPSGTSREILPGRRVDTHSNSLTWKVKSFQFWGESVVSGFNGAWKLSVQDIFNRQNQGFLKSWKLIIHGMSSFPQAPWTRVLPKACTRPTSAPTAG
ncbi:neuroendocrine convertase 1-like [Lingula anatina]|uniref:Neuroendocrine convertase 1-like n=1 Tax=Lingula anatina TaxID=7574 RepID=A0A1S3I384_LINAN|nr:neuroendocrine convertase 1-like [Lingula anatina]|eukprot:XP_013392730.1 neuroendocrine convertase 1-like [Lingula anatina]